MPQIAGNDLVFSYMTVYARWIVSAVLLVASTAKMQDLSEFVITVQSFRILPKQLSRAAGSLIFGLELIIGVSLFVGVGVRFTTPAGLLLFGCFTVAILVNLVRHNFLNCNCFGPYFKEKISASVVLRNLLFMMLCWWIWRFYDGYLALDSWLFERIKLRDYPLEPFILLTAAIIVSGISILIARMVLKNFKSIN